jgi:hypothetical protein
MEEDAMKITNSIWFSPLGLIGQIGIVLGEDEATGQRKAYIGIGYGVSDTRDEQLVAQYGSKFPAEMAERIAAWLKEEPTDQTESSQQNDVTDGGG